jgi:hypothetical protein
MTMQEAVNAPRFHQWLATRRNHFWTEFL